MHATAHPGHRPAPGPPARSAPSSSCSPPATDFRSAQEIHAELRAGGSRGGPDHGVQQPARARRPRRGRHRAHRGGRDPVPALRAAGAHHHHLVCRVCGATVEISGPGGGALGRDRGRSRGLRRRAPHRRDRRHLPAVRAGPPRAAALSPADQPSPASAPRAGDPLVGRAQLRRRRHHLRALPDPVEQGHPTGRGDGVAEALAHLVLAHLHVDAGDGQNSALDDGALLRRRAKAASSSSKWSRCSRADAVHDEVAVALEHAHHRLQRGRCPAAGCAPPREAAPRSGGRWATCPCRSQCCARLLRIISSIIPMRWSRSQGCSPNCQAWVSSCRISQRRSGSDRCARDAREARDVGLHQVERRSRRSRAPGRGSAPGRTGRAPAAT